MDRPWEHKVAENIEYFDQVEGDLLGKRNWPNHVREAIRWLGEEIVEPPTVEQIAERLNVNERSLRRRFKAMTGLSMRAYLRRLRATRAVAVLTLHPDIQDQHMNRWFGYAQPRSMRRAIATEYGVGTRIIRGGSGVVTDAIAGHRCWIESWWQFR